MKKNLHATGKLLGKTPQGEPTITIKKPHDKGIFAKFEDKI